MEYRQALGSSLRKIRLSRGLGQESFVEVSGRTYISELERGLKGVTVEKLIEIAGLLDVHPLTVLLDSFCLCDEVTPERLLDEIAKELEELKLVGG